ncbi:ATP-dependent DNA helicase Pif1-like [Oculina patagonica]
MLNKEQKEFFYHILHLVKTSDKSFYSFLSGGAGVGKSHLTKALYQATLKFLNSLAGDDFHQVKILLLAPTGKAAYNIKGNTIHSALAIPASQSLKNYKPLDSSRLNTLRCHLGGLKVIFLDEISMVGNSMFTVQINNRLKDIKGSNEDFGGVSIITIGDLFQLQPVMDSYIFKDIDDSKYGLLAPNLWQQYFKMFELCEIMRQKDSKIFAEILNRLREGKHSKGDILKLRQRMFTETDLIHLRDVPRLFIQNSKVDEFNVKAHSASQGCKYRIKSQDSVIGANSLELKEKIIRQIPNDPRKTKQLASFLHVAEGERTEIAINVRTDDGMTNGAANVIKLIQLHDKEKPSGIIWVQFDDLYVGQKTRHDNRTLYTQHIQPLWTPIRPVTTQFAVGRNRAAQVIRKQFPLRPAAAKTIHRSQGDTETKIIVDFDTRKAIPHIHYVGLSRVTTIDGLYITRLCEDKIAVSSHVQTEMKRLRTEAKLDLSFVPFYKMSQSCLIMYFLNARSLHRHIKDIQKDFNFSSAHIAIFSETRFSSYDSDEMYAINGFTLFRNDSPHSNSCTRPYSGMAVYSKLPFFQGYPYCQNSNGIEVTVLKITALQQLTVIGVYRSPKVPITQLCRTLRPLLSEHSHTFNIVLGDFNVNWINETERRPLYNLFITEFNYSQLISSYTTDNKTAIDHIYTNITDCPIASGTLETYFSDHKVIWASLEHPNFTAN